MLKWYIQTISKSIVSKPDNIPTCGYTAQKQMVSSHSRLFFELHLWEICLPSVNAKTIPLSNHKAVEQTGQILGCLASAVTSTKNNHHPLYLQRGTLRQFGILLLLKKICGIFATYVMHEWGWPNEDCFSCFPPNGMGWANALTAHLTTSIELLTTMMATQKINKSGWIDPSDDWGWRHA